MARKTYTLLMLILLLLSFGGNAQQLQKTANIIPGSFRISEEEMRLYRMINDYRQRYDLPPIPISVSLCYVATAHVRDLFFHHPDQGACNFHSWSDKGPWKAFCYPKDENKKNSVWDKPKEFTPYKDKGYEIVYWENNPVDIDSIINFWKSADYFNSFLMNTGKWKGTKWEAIGIGIYENYACAWFGQLPDPYGPPMLVGESTATEYLPLSGKINEPVKPEEKQVQEGPVISREDSTVITPPVNASNTGSLKYNIIVRTNILLKDTAKFVKFYSEKGYPAAKSLVIKGKARISIYETSDRTEAMAKLREVKLQYKDAWLLKR